MILVIVLLYPRTSGHVTGPFYGRERGRSMSPSPEDHRKLCATCLARAVSRECRESRDKAIPKRVLRAWRWLAGRRVTCALAPEKVGGYVQCLLTFSAGMQLGEVPEQPRRFRGASTRGSSIRSYQGRQVNSLRERQIGNFGGFCCSGSQRDNARA